jgi:hypothetical protein
MRLLAVLALLAVGCVDATDHAGEANVRGGHPDPVPPAYVGPVTGAGGAVASDAGVAADATPVDATPPPVCANPYPLVYSVDPCTTAPARYATCGIDFTAVDGKTYRTVVTGCVLDPRIGSPIGGLACVAACP